MQWKGLKTKEIGRYLICIYLPVAMATGVANLAIDKVIPEGVATIHVHLELETHATSKKQEYVHRRSDCCATF